MDFMRDLHVTRHRGEEPYTWIGPGAQGRDPLFASLEPAPLRSVSNKRVRARMELSCTVGLGDVSLRKELSRRADEAPLTA